MLKHLIKHLQLAGFRSARDEFYEALARSYDNREGLRFFLEAELKISMARKTRDASRAYALRLMRAKLARGDNSTFVRILGAVMPAQDLMLLSALDDAPDKSELMRMIARTIREQRLMRQTVRNRILPPLLILPGAFGFCYLMATRMLPIIEKVAPPGVWTPFNSAVRGFSGFMADHGLSTVALVTCLGALLSYQLPRWTGRMRSLFEGMTPNMATLVFPIMPWVLPLIVYRDFQAGQLFSVLSVMLQSGRTLKEALMAIRRRAQPWMRWHLGRVIRYLEVNPTGYQRAFEGGVVSAHMLARLSSQMRSSPRFDDVLIRLGQEGTAEVREVVNKQMTLLNAVLLSLGAGLVVFVYIGQLSISQSLQEELSPSKQMMRRAPQ